MTSTRICGVPIAVCTSAEAVRRILDAASDRRPLEVHLCNSYTLSLVDQDARLRAALLRAELNLPDGTPVAWLARRAGCAGPVRGPSLMRDVLVGGVERGTRHYLWGGAPGVAGTLAASIREEHHGVIFVGAEAPPYHDLSTVEIDALVRRIRDADADVAWIGLGTPRQDHLVPILAEALRIPVVPVGAAFDFLSGRILEAPSFLHGSGLEWVYRLVREPRRLWRRYVLGNPRFVTTVVRHRRDAAVG